MLGWRDRDEDERPLTRAVARDMRSGGIERGRVTNGHHELPPIQLEDALALQAQLVLLAVVLRGALARHPNPRAVSSMGRDPMLRFMP